MFKRFILILGLVFVPTLGYSAPFELKPITNLKVVAEFPLTEEFLSKVEKIQKEIPNLPPETAAKGTGNDDSIEGLTESITGRPKLTELITKNGLQPREYVIGTMALQASLAAAASIDDKTAIFDETIVVSKDNLEFGKKYTDRIRALFD